MSKLFERLIEAALILGLVWILSGCATVRGLAQDISWTADKIAENINTE